MLEQLAIAKGEKKRRNVIEDSNFLQVPVEESRIARMISIDDEPLKQTFWHYSVSGPGDHHPCLRDGFQRPLCPLCKLATRFYSESKQKDDAAWNASKKLFSSERYVSCFVVRSEEEKGPRWFWYSKTNFKALITDYFLNEEEYGDIADSDTGNDVEIKVEPPENKGGYNRTTIKAKIKKTKLVDAAMKKAGFNTVQDVLTAVPNFREIVYPEPTVDSLNQAVQNYLNSAENEQQEENKGKKEVAPSLSEQIDAMLTEGE